MALATNIPLSLFPLENYEQDIAKWISPSDPSYREPLLQPVYQNARLSEIKNTLFSFYNFAARFKSTLGKTNSLYFFQSNISPGSVLRPRGGAIAAWLTILSSVIFG